MTTTQSNSPEKEANRLTSIWQKFGPNLYPLDIDGLIDGVITKSDFRGEIEVKRGIFDSFEGCLVRTNGMEKWTILINEATENKRRQRFTFAHELGHFMCHRYLQDTFEDSEKSLNDFKGKLEREANIFASWLLMPANLLRAEFGRQNWSSELLCEIGSRFECSLQASALRYVNISERPCAFVVSRDGMILWTCRSKSAPYLLSYKFGDELPLMSAARMTPEDGATTTEVIQSGLSWNNLQCCKESQYFDRSGMGYQYTCIEFTG